ncbi:MAG: hydroxyacid dehydrogenase [Rectinemataceae bacterium]|nr:hydroxyacid dehydrogenase [Rectinemataceae bacterium]
MKKVLIDRPLHADALSLLSEGAEVVAIFDDNREKLEKALKEVDGVICSAALKMREHEISMGTSIKVIGRPGVGYDSVDVESCSRHRIPLVYTPDGPTESVAEHVIAMILMAAKQILVVQKALREKGDFGIRNRVTGMEVQGKTLGLAGFGRIGKRVGEIAAKGLGMKVVVFDPYLKGKPDTGFEYGIVENLESLTKDSDFLSLHIPYSPETDKMFGGKEFAAMKKTAVFINTSRGGVVDEAAMIEALQSGKIAGAGLDVFEKEPPAKDNPLFAMENVIVTPHLSSFTEDGKRKMGIAVVEGVLDVFSGKKPQFLVNGEIWETRRT